MMRLLLLMGLWVLVATPLALLIGNAIRGSNQSVRMPAPDRAAALVDSSGNPVQFEEPARSVRQAVRISVPASRKASEP